MIIYSNVILIISILIFTMGGPKSSQTYLKFKIVFVLFLVDRKDMSDRTVDSVQMTEVSLLCEVAYSIAGGIF